MLKYRSVLLLKLPFCTHPDAMSVDENFRTKAPFRPVPSLALAALAAFFEKYKSADYRLKVIDSNIEAYTRPGVPIDTSVYLDLVTRIITDNDYDVLALSTLFVFNVRWVETAVQLSRKLRPRAKIILGGGYPTLFPEHALERHPIDSVVIGEGEATFLHILNKYNNIKDDNLEEKFPVGGYAERNEKGEIVNVPIAKFIDPADLPTPAWDKLDIDRYFKNSGDRLLPIEGSRGCPYSCTYCCTYLSWGKKVRYKPVDHLLNEMTELGEKYDIGILHFNDDNLGFRKEWLIEFLTRAQAEKFPFKFSASNYSVLHLDEEVINLLVKVYGPGQFVGIAVETGSLAMQRLIRKNLDFDKIRDVVRIMKEKKLHVHIHWMVGFPGETIEQIRETFAFARELRGHSNQFLTVTPYPGTRLFQEAEESGLLNIPEYDFDKYDNRRSEYLKSDQWDYKLLQEMIYDANIEINFLNHPQLDIPDEIDEFLTYLTELLKRLPDHIISRILVGFIHMKKGNPHDREEYYRSAYQRFSDKGLCNTFLKYLDWEYESIVDFKNYLREKELPLPECN
jgi:anaerobic magnesium-protoporphyrin IX monomethyl ester cyclase